MESSGVALLSNDARYTIFEYGDSRIKFIGPKPLEHYVEVTEWDCGYLVVQTKYSVSDAPIEEYIDLVPVLQNLYIDPTEFCSPIRCVEVKHV